MHRLLDELLAVYVVFQTPLLEEATLKSYLARLVISVEAFAFSTVPPSDQDAKATPPKEVIFQHAGHRAQASVFIFECPPLPTNKPTRVMISAAILETPI